jgi:hypothetical protein
VAGFLAAHAAEESLFRKSTLDRVYVANRGWRRWQLVSSQSVCDFFWLAQLRRLMVTFDALAVPVGAKSENLAAG